MLALIFPFPLARTGTVVGAGNAPPDLEMMVALC